MSDTSDTDVVPGPGPNCGAVNETDKIGLRIGAIFAVLVTSLVGTLFPIVTKRTARLRSVVPGWVFEFGKFFGSGVILATALVHLMDPAIEEIGLPNTYSYGGCLSDDWGEFPYPMAICMASLFIIFVLEVVALRLGKNFRVYDVQTRPVGDVNNNPYTLEQGVTAESSHMLAAATADPNRTATECTPTQVLGKEDDDDGTESYWKDSSESTPPEAQILGVAILEFGILFHSASLCLTHETCTPLTFQVIVGMTLSLADPDEFVTLFIVIIFHQMFEGVGLGTRLAFLRLPDSWRWVPLMGGILYAAVTPIGMAIGLGARESLSMSTASASIASGVLDSISAGVLLYAATVELMAHEFIFNPYYHNCSWGRLVFVLGSFAAGAGIMSLLAKWA